MMCTSHDVHDDKEQHLLYVKFYSTVHLVNRLEIHVLYFDCWLLKCYFLSRLLSLPSANPSQGLACQSRNVIHNFHSPRNSPLLHHQSLVNV